MRRLSLGICLALLGCHAGLKIRGDAGCDGSRVLDATATNDAAVPDPRDALAEAGPTGFCDKVVAVAAETVHVCAVAGDGSLWCWGDNRDGQLGDGTTESKAAPVRVASLGTDVVQVALSYHSTCALSGNGSIWCWGNNQNGQLGNDKRTGSLAPEAVKGVEGQARQLVAGGSVCVRTDGGKVWCWGFVSDDSIVNVNSRPYQVDGLADVLDIAVGASHLCVLKSDGTVWCWGGNLKGQLGDGSRKGGLVPIQVKGLAAATRIFAGADGSCALKTDGTLWCWGAVNGSPVPALVGRLPDTVEVALGIEHSCARRADGTMWCWGGNGHGQLGDGSLLPSDLPVMAGGVTGARHVTVGYEFTCAIDSTSKLLCWGGNDWGTLGIGRRPAQTIPKTVASLKSPVAQLSAADQAFCVRTLEGSVSCWGNSFYTIVGYGPQSVIAAPVTMTSLGTSAVDIASGGAGTSCAVLADGGVWCWGMVSDQGVFARQPVPVEISDLAPARRVAVGWGHACAQTDDGVSCWGRNDLGQLGNGLKYLFAMVPGPVKGLAAEVVQLASSYSHTCARMADGALWCWGDNSWGQLGDGTNTERLTPVQVAGLSGKAHDVATGWGNTCAVLVDGTTWCWGQNDLGQLAADKPASSPSPVRIAGLPPALAVSIGENHICALALGEVWCWGRNDQGQFGNGTTEPWREGAALPVRAQAPGVAFVEVSAGANATCARTADGTVWCWGTQNHGLQADGQLGYSPKPVAVAGCR
jgi:alpha-tubulin suppressor-like RCC1 family protein